MSHLAMYEETFSIIGWDLVLIDSEKGAEKKAVKI